MRKQFFSVEACWDTYVFWKDFAFTLSTGWVSGREAKINTAFDSPTHITRWIIIIGILKFPRVLPAFEVVTHAHPHSTTPFSQKKSAQLCLSFALCLSKWKNGIIRAWNKNDDIKREQQRAMTQPQGNMGIRGNVDVRHTDGIGNLWFLKWDTEL